MNYTNLNSNICNFWSKIDSFQTIMMLFLVINAYSFSSNLVSFSFGLIFYCHSLILGCPKGFSFLESQWGVIIVVLKIEKHTIRYKYFLTAIQKNVIKIFCFLNKNDKFSKKNLWDCGHDKLTNVHTVHPPTLALIFWSLFGISEKFKSEK